MKRTASIVLCLVCTVLSLTGCKKNNNEITKTESIVETTNVSTVVQEENKIQKEKQNETLCFGLNGLDNESLSIIIPNEISDKCIPKYTSNFQEGWVKITFSTIDEKFDLFTIYSSTDDSYKEYQNQVGYEIIGNDGIQTIIWFENQQKENNNENVAIIEKLQSYFNIIKKSIIISANYEE